MDFSFYYQQSKLNGEAGKMQIQTKIKISAIEKFVHDKKKQNITLSFH